MLSNIRKLRFSSKVKIEREILSLINSSNISHHHKLAGMTKEAVLTWQEQISKDVPDINCNSIVGKLLEISRNAQIISDTSRTVFAEGSYFDNKQYEHDKTSLKNMLF